MKTSLICSLVILLFSGWVQAEAPKKAASCVACHGKSGVSTNAEWPNLAGQKKAYMVDQITAFRDGVRSNPMMAPMLADLTDADIEQLAEYYSSQPRATAANGDKTLVAQGQNRAAYCFACHGMKGITANEQWPNLAGQQAKYLESQLHAFKKGERVNALMQNLLADIDDADFAALAAFFSQLKP